MQTRAQAYSPHYQAARTAAADRSQECSSSVAARSRVDDLRSNPPSFAIKGKVFNGSGTLIGAERTLFTQGSDGRAPGVRGEVFNGREYFLVLSRATPPLNPFDFNAYTNQSLAGAFMTP